MDLFIRNLQIISLFLYAAYCVSSFNTKPDLQTRLLEDDELDGQVTLHLYHSLEPSDSPPIYTKRGIITINSARNEAVYVEESPLSASDVEQLKNLAAHDDVYRVKILSRPDEPDHNSVFSFTKAIMGVCSIHLQRHAKDSVTGLIMAANVFSAICAIYESGPTDVITVTLDQSNVPVGVSVSANPPYCSGSSLENFRLGTFNTTVNIVPLANGPSPDTLTYIQRIEQEKAEKARGEQGDNRSFFAKYWMYIVPFVIILVMSGATGPEAQNAG